MGNCHILMGNCHKLMGNCHKLMGNPVIYLNFIFIIKVSPNEIWFIFPRRIKNSLKTTSGSFFILKFILHSAFIIVVV